MKMSIEELVKDLQRLTPQQIEYVASIVHGFSLGDGQQNEVANRVAIPSSIVDEAVRHRWPKELFTELIGSLPELERAPQPAYDTRAT